MCDRILSAGSLEIRGEKKSMLTGAIWKGFQGEEELDKT